MSRVGQYDVKHPEMTLDDLLDLKKINEFDRQFYIDGLAGKTYEIKKDIITELHGYDRDPYDFRDPKYDRLNVVVYGTKTRPKMHIFIYVNFFDLHEKTCDGQEFHHMDKNKENSAVGNILWCDSHKTHQGIETLQYGNKKLTDWLSDNYSLKGLLFSKTDLEQVEELIRLGKF